VINKPHQISFGERLAVSKISRDLPEVHPTKKRVRKKSQASFKPPVRLFLKFNFIVLILLLLLPLPRLLHDNLWGLKTLIAGTFQFQMALVGMFVLYLIRLRLGAIVKVGLWVGGGLLPLHFFDLIRITLSGSPHPHAILSNGVCALFSLCGFLVFRTTHRKIKRSGQGWANKIPKRSKNLLVVLSLLLCGGVVLEYGARLMTSADGTRASLWRWDTLHVQLNDMGFRSPPVEWDKWMNSRRILILGQEAAYGMGIPQDELINVILKKRLETEFPVEIINASKPHWDIDDQIEFFDAWKQRLKPHLVILAHDMSEIYPPQMVGVKDFLGSHSYLMGLLLPLGRHKVHDTSSPQLNDTINDLNRLKSMAQTMNSQLILMILPQAVHNDVAFLAEAQNQFCEEIHVYHVPCVGQMASDFPIRSSRTQLHRMAGITLGDYILDSPEWVGLETVK
jgi:hypothetical protein